MNQKPARLPLNRHCVFRSGLVAALLLAATVASRAQPVPPPELQFTISSGGIAPVGFTWTLSADARIIGGRFDSALEPVVLSISSPLLDATAYGPLWLGWGSSLVSANLPTAVPTPATGVYDVVARASTADWVAYMNYVGWSGITNWLDDMLPPAARMETTITRQVTIVGIETLSASAYHVAIGDPVTHTVTMTPVNTFDLVYWDEHGSSYDGTGETYTRVMTGSGPWGPAVNGVLAVTATCGNVTFTNLITVYQITGLSASQTLVPVGTAVDFTVTIDPPGGSPPPVEWFVDGVSQGSFPNNTFTASNLAPTNYVVTAVLGTSGKSSETVTVVGIGSVSISGPDYNGTNAPGSVKYIYQNDTYTFTATAAPEGAAWPPNQPQWTINGTTTTGSNAPGTFGTLSTSISNFKTAVASCGTSSESVGIIVFNVDLEVKPEDDFAGRSTNEFGLGEIINYKAFVHPAGLTFDMVGLGWFGQFPAEAVFDTNSTPPMAVSGFVALASVSSPGGTGSAAPTVPTPTATASLSSVAVPGTYTVGIRNSFRIMAFRDASFIAPTSAEYVITSAPIAATFNKNPDTGAPLIVGPTPVHEIGTISAMQGFEVWVKPETVSWNRIKFREGECVDTLEGAFASLFGTVSDVHPIVGPCAVNPPISGKGCKVDFVDASGVFFRTPANFQIPMAFAGRWFGVIPLEYGALKAMNGTLEEIWVPFDSAPFSFNIDVYGALNCVKKGIPFTTQYFGPTVIFTLPP